MGDNLNRNSFEDKVNSDPGVNLVNQLNTSDSMNIPNPSGAPLFGRRISITANLLGKARDWFTGNTMNNVNGDKEETFTVGSYSAKRSTSIIPTDDILMNENIPRRSRSRSLGSESDLVVERRDIIIPGPVF